jgi:muramidase (phage lysozyme)
MPYCTWAPESHGYYRALNRSSMAGGKYQMLPSTFHAFGGRGWPHLARPLIQERIARRVLRGQGIHAWVNC